MLSTLFLEVVLKKHDTAESFFPAEQFVKEVELEIGGQKIDKITSDWLRLYSEVYHSSDEKAGYRRLVDFDDPSAGGDAGVEKRFFVPINFFFTRYAMHSTKGPRAFPTSTVNRSLVSPISTTGPRPWPSRLWPSSTTR